MMTTRASMMRPGLASVPALLTALALLAFVAPSPASAGGLDDFFKKGSKDSKSSGQSSSSGSSSSSSGSSSNSSSSKETKSPLSFERDSGGDSSLWSKPGKRETTTTTPRKSGGLFDLFNKRTKPQPAPRGSRPGGQPPAVSFERTQPGSGGLIDLFRKPGRPQPAPTTSVAPVPSVVVYHYHDPWYYPYDGFFYRYYGPYIIREREIYYGGWPYNYERPSPEEEAEERANDALRNIERGWRESRYALIARYIDNEGTLAIFHDGEYSHAMTAREFRALTLQAFEDVQTIRFRFFETQMVRTTQCVADGEHVFVGPDGDERRVEVQYTLRKTGRRWLIRSIDLRQERRLSSSLAPIAPDRVVPALSLASFDPEVTFDEGIVLARAYTGLEEDLLGAPAIPPPSGPQVTLEDSLYDVVADEVPVPAILVAVAEAAPAATAAPAAESSLRVVCESKALRLAALRAAKKPVKVATVTCVVLKAAPGSSLVPGSRLTCDLHIGPAKDGLAWSLLHKGEKRALESGTIPAEKLKAAQSGHLRVVVDRVTTPITDPSGGEQHQTLYTKVAWDYLVALVTSPKAPPAKPVRTEVLISAKTGQES